MQECGGSVIHGPSDNHFVPFHTCSALPRNWARSVPTIAPATAYARARPLLRRTYAEWRAGPGDPISHLLSCTLMRSQNTTPNAVRTFNTNQKESEQYPKRSSTLNNTRKYAWGPEVRILTCSLVRSCAP